MTQTSMAGLSWLIPIIWSLYEILNKTDTDNPLYTDTRYNDKIRYNDILTVTQPSLKR